MRKNSSGDGESAGESVNAALSAHSTGKLVWEAVEDRKTTCGGDRASQSGDFNDPVYSLPRLVV